MTNNTDQKKWYVIRTAYLRGAVVKSYLDNRRIENFRPAIPREGKGNIGTNAECEHRYPAINDLIFIRTSPSQLLEILTSARLSVRCLLDMPSQSPVVIEEKQMRDFITVINAAAGRAEIAGPERIDLTKGERVHITAGIYSGIDGICFRHDGQCKVAVVIDNIVAALTSRIPERHLQPMHESAASTTVRK